MKALILAAGKGERMKPLTNTMPKVMLPVAGKPIMEHLLEEAKRAGIKEFIIIIGYYSDVVRGYFGDGAKWGVHISYVMQKNQLGTADAIIRARGNLGGNFIALNGDCIIRSTDIKRLASAKTDTIGVTERLDVRGYGVVSTEGKRVLSIEEKAEFPKGNLVNTGAYLFSQNIFEEIEKTQESVRGEYEITTSLEQMIAGGKDVFNERLDSFIDVSYPWDILSANEGIMNSLKGSCKGIIEEGAVIKGEVEIGEGTVIRSGSYLQGPIIISKNCEIGPNCYIRPNTTIGESCHIGASCEVKNSVILKGTKVPHHNYIGDSLVGENCNFGAGTKIANLRFDEANVKAGSADTKRRKFGAAIGSGARTGINVSINSGTIIGDSAVVYPGAVVNGVIEPHAVIS